jgi:hypothetical protein
MNGKVWHRCAETRFRSVAGNISHHRAALSVRKMGRRMSRQSPYGPLADAVRVSTMDSAKTPECLFKLPVSSRDALLDWLRPRVSRLMLEEIAKNDYEENVSEQLAAIEMLMGQRPVSGSPEFRAREVLQLEQWSEPELPHRDSPPSGERGHQKRLLACTLLLREMAELKRKPEADDDFVPGSAPTVIQLTRSAIALGEDVSRPAIAFLLWLRGVQRHPRFSPFASFCTLLLGIQVGIGPASDQDLSELLNWVERDEAVCRESLGWHVKSPRWLTGLNSHMDNRDNRDRLLDCSRRILTGPVGQYPETQKRLQQLLDRIAA